MSEKGRSKDMDGDRQGGQSARPTRPSVEDREAIDRRLALFIESQRFTRIGSWEWDLETGQLTWSDEMYRLFGLVPGEPPPSLYEWIERFVYKPDQAGLAAAMGRGFADHATHSVEYRIRRLDGQIRRVWMQGRIFCGPDGAPQRAVGSIQDITEKRDIEFRLKRKLEYEALLSDVSAEFATVGDRGDLDRVMDRTLAKTAEFLEADRGLFLELDESSATLTCGHQWCRPTATRVEMAPDGTSVPQPWLMRRLSDGQPLAIDRTEDLPDVARATRQQLEHQGVESSIFIPIESGDAALGGLRFDRLEPSDDWSDSSLSRMKLLGDLVASVILKLETDEKLRQAHAQLQHITAFVSTGLWSARRNANGTWSDHYHSPVMQEITGRPFAFFNNLPQRWMSTLHPDDQQEYARALDQLVENAPAHVEQEYRIRLPDGELRWVRDSMNSRRLDDGGIRLDGALADVTDRKRAETALRANEEQFRQLAENIDGALWLRECESGRLLYVSPKFAGAFGTLHPYLLSSPDDRGEAVHFEDRERVRHAFAAAHFGAYDVEYRVLQGADVRWIRERAFPIRDDSGRVYRQAGIVEEISERKAAEEELRSHHEKLAHAGRLSTMGELVAGIAHEINQPLYAVTNYAGACRNSLSADTSPDDRLSCWIGEIETQARRAGAILERLANFTSKSNSHRSTLDINRLVLESVDLFSFETRRRHVRVRLQLATPPPMVHADRVEIQQILVNLMRNAVDAMDDVDSERRTVAISTTESEEHVTVHVEDRGVGLADSKSDELFEPFHTTKADGMGMGLAICRSIIESHNGHIWATSNSERGADQQGAAFHFQLPLVKGPA